MHGATMKTLHFILGMQSKYSGYRGELEGNIIKPDCK